MIKGLVKKSFCFGILLAKKLEAELIDIDDLNDRIPNFDLSIAIDETNKLTRQGKSVVLSYVIRDANRRQVIEGLDDKNPEFITLAPKIGVAQSDRGRGLSEWEIQRIKYHYDTGIADPGFGKVIDASDLTLEPAVQKILESINKLPSFRFSCNSIIHGPPSVSTISN